MSTRSSAGPVMRRQRRSVIWRQWMIQVIESYSTRTKVYFKAFVDPEVEADARCLGYMSSLYGNPRYRDTCSTPPYGNGVFLNSTLDASEGSPQTWFVRPSDTEEGSFEIVAASKPDTCSRLLAARDCAVQPVLVEPLLRFIPYIGMYTSWEFIQEYEVRLPESPPPPPPMSPLPEPAPSPPLSTQAFPGPVISAPISTIIGSVNVVISSLGGGKGCNVVLVEIQSSTAGIGSVPQYVEVSASQPGLDSVGVPVPLVGGGYNVIRAIGTCSTGEKTEMSNQISVFFSAPGPPLPPGSAAFTLKYIGLNASLSDQSDENQVCSNIKQIQSWISCRIVSVVPGSAVTTGLATFPSDQAASNLVNQLLGGTEENILMQGTWNSGTPSGVVTEAAEAFSEPEPATAPVVDSVALKPGQESTTVVVTWTPGTDSVPYATNPSFVVSCVPRGTPCNPSPDFANDGVDRPAGQTSTDVTGLTANTAYDCYVVAKSGSALEGVCSTNSSIATLPIAPSNVQVSSGAISGTQIQVTATPATQGSAFSITNKVQCLNASSLASPPLCDTSGTWVDAPNLAGGQQVGSLSTKTAYTCFAAATWMDGGGITQYACSGPSSSITTGSFYLADNGVTVMCPDAAVGESGMINTVKYTKVTDAAKIKKIWKNGDPSKLVTTCTSGVTDMTFMFDSASSFNQNISSWDTSQVTYMSYMFLAASLFNQDISKWDTSKVQQMDYMFLDASSFNQNISSWNVQNVLGAYYGPCGEPVEFATNSPIQDKPDYKPQWKPCDTKV